MTTLVVVPWHNESQLQLFLNAWKITTSDTRIVFQQDPTKEGCAKTKNRGIKKAIELGAGTIVVLDDDCFPGETQSIGDLITGHEIALRPQQVSMVELVTDPPSRGTPYFDRTIEMPVAASMGFWTHIGDYDAPGQLVHGATKPMQFKREPIFGKYFALCGMNLAFRASEWPWCKFVNVARFDDIWQGFLWQKKAYANGQCFNLAGPVVRHSRQSNVWANLQDESKSLEKNETLWKKIHAMKIDSHEQMANQLGFVYE